MKKLKICITSLIISIFFIFSFSACLPWGFVDTDSEIEAKNATRLVSSLDSKDPEQIKALFAPNIVADISDFDNSISQLLEYYNGNYVSLEDRACATFNDTHKGHIIKDQQMTRDIKTTAGIYRIAVFWRVQDNQIDGDIGIWSFNIIKYEDDYKQNYSYWGDGTNSNGIHIGEIYAVRYIDKLANCLYGNDREAVKALFAFNAVGGIENFDKQVDNLILFYNGCFSDFTYNKQIIKYESKNGGEYSCYYEISCDFITTLEDDYLTKVEAYRVCAKWYTKDTGNADNVGLWSFYITKANGEDDEPYCGDGLWTNGINIETEER